MRWRRRGSQAVNAAGDAGEMLAHGIVEDTKNARPPWVGLQLIRFEEHAPADWDRIMQYNNTSLDRQALPL